MKETMEEKKLFDALYALVDEMHWGASLYAIVDTGIYRDFIDILDIENPPHRILFKDTFVPEYENVAPYLVALNREDDFSKALVSKGHGETWLSFVVSRQDIATLAYELKERINIYSQAHEREIILRFYDPRNMQQYFNMLDEDEKETLFKDINGYFAHVNVEDIAILNTYNPQGKQSIPIQKRAS